MRRAIALDGVRPEPEPEPVSIVGPTLAERLAACAVAGQDMSDAIRAMGPTLERLYQAQTAFGHAVRRR